MKRRKLVRAILAILSVVTGLFLFDEIGFEVQVPYAMHIPGVTWNMFAILGVWIAVLDPRRLLSGEHTQVATTHDPLLSLLEDLIGPWVQVTAVFAWLIVHVLLLTTLKTAIAEPGNATINARSGVFLVLSTFLILDALIGTLLPVAFIGRSFRQSKKRLQSRDGKNDPA